MRTLIILAMLVILASLVTVVPVAATDDGGEATTTTVGEAPTTLPEGGVEDTDPDDGRVAPWWLLILVGVALIMIVAALVTRGSPQAPVQSSTTWKDRARIGYADARWLADSLTEDLAIWRGNAAAGPEVSATASGGALADTWKHVPTRLENAKAALYALEASAPDSRTASIAQATVRSLDVLRSAVDARADARAHYRIVESAEGGNDEALAAARDREIRSSTNLHRARNELSTSLGSLSTIL